MTQDRLYIVLISVHGLIRAQAPELGRDADTGGQTLYVLELARELASRPEVAQVDLLTRRIVDPAVAEEYAHAEETLCDKARIVRLDCGPSGYLPKESLWDNLTCFVDNALVYLHTTGRHPDVIHSHYADAGFVGTRLARQLGVPLVFTAHSLGRVKRRRLLAAGLSPEDVETRFAMSRRIEAEEEALATAHFVVTSTRQEIEEQYALYAHAQTERMRVLPPGVDLSRFHPPQAGDESELAPLRRMLSRFLRDADKPLILALSRADPRKNIASLVQAYAQTPRLREQANLLIVAGNRDDLRDMESGPREVLTELLLLIDRHDLYGQVAYPKQHAPDEVPCFYRLAACSGGVFVNPALTEPFGLTLLEAAASGLPVVATEDGGPRDILAACGNGHLTDPLDPTRIASALLDVLGDRAQWQAMAQRGLEGVKRHYTWRAHVHNYLQLLGEISRQAVAATASVTPSTEEIGTLHPLLRQDRALVVDLDESLDPNSPGHAPLMQLIRAQRSRAGWILTTQLSLVGALTRIKALNLPLPDALICAQGTEIHYHPRLSADRAWSRHILHDWNADAIRAVVNETPGWTLAPVSRRGGLLVEATTIRPEAALPALRQALHDAQLSVTLIDEGENRMALLPARASKGYALRHIALRWHIDLDRLLVVGAAPSDEDMLRGNPLGAVVTPRARSVLAGLGELSRVYFSQADHEAGILEAIAYYDFHGDCRVPGREPA